LALVVAGSLLVGACSEDGGSGTDGGSGGGETASGETTFVEGTLSSGETGETTAATAGEGTAQGPPDAVLRLEGDSGTRFSGICTVGDERTVINGRVPKRFAYELGGEELSCQIQKRGEGSGTLKVTLIAGQSTRSVQQTNSPEGTIDISYRGS
jgi:hypothetical protein